MKIAMLRHSGLNRTTAEGQVITPPRPLKPG
jgi:hypothetical protein